MISNEDIKIYTKTGDYNKALEDFRSLRPTNVESYTFDLGVVRMFNNQKILLPNIILSFAKEDCHH